MSTEQEYKDRGNAAYRQKKWTQAIADFQKAIDILSSSSDIDDKKKHELALLHSNMSAAQLKAGEFKAALNSANQAIECDKKFYKGYGRKGAAYHAMQEYELAVAAYQEGLEFATIEEREHLNKGIVAAQRAQVQAAPATRAAHRRKSATTTTQKQKQKPATVSTYLQQVKCQVALQMIALEAEMELLNELEQMTVQKKLEFLFTLIDKDGDGAVNVFELAAVLRSDDQDPLPFADSIDQAMNLIAAFDTNKDARLDMNEFMTCMSAVSTEVGEGFCDFMILHMLFNEQDTEEAAILALNEDIQDELNEQVMARERLFAMMKDPRMIQLFHLFDKDGSRQLSFQEVAVGLYQVTQNMDESIRATMGLLLMLDKDDKRTLNYEQFGRLVMALVAASGTTFDTIVDEMIVAITQNDSITEEALGNLIVGDAVYETTKDLQLAIEEQEQVVDALSYGRLEKLFNLWDRDSDGSISATELAHGLAQFETAAGITDSNVALEAAELVGACDEDGDNVLDPVEFARAIVKFANALDVDLNDLIDFMCVSSVLVSDVDVLDFQYAYGQSLGLELAPMVQPVYLQYYELPGDLGDEENAGSLPERTNETAAQENRKI